MPATLKQYGPTMLVAAAILYLSLASGSGLPKTNFHIPNGDKLVHACMYLGLAMVMTLDMRRSGIKQPKLLLIGMLAPIAYGGLIELIQPYFPPRTAEWLDFAADSVGTLVGMGMAGLIARSAVWKKYFSPS